MLKINEILNALEDAELYRNGGDVSSSYEIDAVVTDTRKVCKNSLFVALEGENFDGHDFLDEAVTAGAAVLCVSANFAEKRRFSDNVTVVTVPDTLTAYRQIAHYYRKKLKDLTVIGITGSCGKTSVKEILKTLLSALYGEDAVYATEANNNNHIGVPLSLLSLKQSHRFAVIEMGSNHPGEIGILAEIAEPNIAVITTISRAHLEFLGDLHGVAKEKSSILKAYGNSKSPIAVIPEECPGNDILRNAAGEHIYTFGDSGADINVRYLKGNREGSTIELSFSGQFKDAEIPDLKIDWCLHGKHQAMNAASAILAVVAIAPERPKEKIGKIENALKLCRLTGMRMQFTEKNGIEWVNDAYNANPDSMKAAIEWLAESADQPNSHIILGDMLEMGEEAPSFHREILSFAAKTLPEAKIYAVGPMMEKAVEEAAGLNTMPQHIKITSFPDSETAAEALKKIIKKGDFVFLKASRGIALEKIRNI